MLPVIRKPRGIVTRNIKMLDLISEKLDPKLEPQIPSLDEVSVLYTKCWQPKPNLRNI